MRTVLQTCIFTLGLISSVYAQDASSCGKPFSAVVTELRGTCFRRESENANPQKLKSSEKILAGHSLQCSDGSSLKIRFCNSHAEKQIVQKAPKWYPVPNVPALKKPSAGDRAGRLNYPDPDVDRGELLARNLMGDELGFWDAFRSKDTGKLNEILADDFHAIDSDGRKVSRAEFLQNMQNTQLVNFLWGRPDSEVGVKDGKILDGYVVYTAFLQFKSKGKKLSILVQVWSSWVFRNGKWLMRSHTHIDY